MLGSTSGGSKGKFNWSNCAFVCRHVMTKSMLWTLTSDKWFAYRSVWMIRDASSYIVPRIANLMETRVFKISQLGSYVTMQDHSVQQENGGGSFAFLDAMEQRYIIFMKLMWRHYERLHKKFLKILPGLEYSVQIPNDQWCSWRLLVWALLSWWVLWVNSIIYSRQRQVRLGDISSLIIN